jgi:hypothetical protein
MQAAEDIDEDGQAAQWTDASRERRRECYHRAALLSVGAGSTTVESRTWSAT